MEYQGLRILFGGANSLNIDLRQEQGGVENQSPGKTQSQVELLTFPFLVFTSK